VSALNAEQGGRLDPATHARIFVEKVIPGSGLDEATSQPRPKAIILAGQPGAGKGGLAKTAESRLSYDVVTVDPDKLRDLHPSVSQFRTDHPYTWPTDTHPDASQWAKELRQVAIEQKKNLIIDTTLGDGDNAVAMIKNLQAQGYEVEVRAIATHWLESELGVDDRFTRDLNKKGFGRYVPEDIRTSVYDALPATLDQVRAETGVPVSIYNREGLYDSRTASRSA
jgi:predicted ABC-type ATPase